MEVKEEETMRRRWRRRQRNQWRRRNRRQRRRWRRRGRKTREGKEEEEEEGSVMLLKLSKELNFKQAKVRDRQGLVSRRRKLVVGGRKRK